MPEGLQAHYFAGVTYEELGNKHVRPETELKTAAGRVNLIGEPGQAGPLAGLYPQMGPDAEGHHLYTPRWPRQASENRAYRRGGS